MIERYTTGANTDYIYLFTDENNYRPVAEAVSIEMAIELTTKLNSHAKLLAACKHLIKTIVDACPQVGPGNRSQKSAEEAQVAIAIVELRDIIADAEPRQR